MNNWALFTLGLVVVSSVFYAILFYFEIYKRNRLKHLTYPIYAAKDKLISAIADGEVYSDDQAFQFVYDCIIKTLQVYKHLTFRKVLIAGVVVKHSVEVEERINDELKIINSANETVSEAYMDYIRGVCNFLYMTSISLRILVKLVPLMKKIKSDLPTPKKYQTYDRFNQCTSCYVAV